MSTQYTLNVKNNSNLPGSICVFQKEPEQMYIRDLYSVAWFSKKCFPGAQLSFQWELDYSLIWSETGGLVPGVNFSPFETRSIDPDNPDQNSLILAKDYSTYRFNSPAEASPRGSISVYPDSSIRPCKVSIGIGVSGKPAFAFEVMPNLRITYTPHPEYWVAFGDFREGEVLDVDSISNAYEVRFPRDVYSVSLNFNQDCTWSESN